MEERVKIIEERSLSEGWFKLKEVIYDYTWFNGKVQRQSREVAKKGNYAGILLYNKEKRTVILTRQFRMPSYLNDTSDGFIVEACAGMLDDDAPEECAKREALEETGFKVKNIEKAFEAYTSPGTLSELAHLYIGAYEDDMKVSKGGGADEDEDIEVLEISFTQALEMIKTGEIKDAKTIMLLQYTQINGLLS